VSICNLDNPTLLPYIESITPKREDFDSSEILTDELIKEIYKAWCERGLIGKSGRLIP